MIGDDDHSTSTVSAGQLRSIVERIERLEEEKREVAAQIKEVFAEAKGAGFHVKTLREIVRLRRLKPEERAEREAMLELYKGALGMGGTPLDAWAQARFGPVAQAVRALGARDRGEEARP